MALGFPPGDFALVQLIAGEIRPRARHISVSSPGATVPGIANPRPEGVRTSVHLVGVAAVAIRPFPDSVPRVRTRFRPRVRGGSPPRGRPLAIWTTSGTTSRECCSSTDPRAAPSPIPCLRRPPSRPFRLSGAGSARRSQPAASASHQRTRENRTRTGARRFSVVRSADVPGARAASGACCGRRSGHTPARHPASSRPASAVGRSARPSLRTSFSGWRLTSPLRVSGRSAPGCHRPRPLQWRTRNPARTGRPRLPQRPDCAGPPSRASPANPAVGPTGRSTNPHHRRWSGIGLVAR